MTDDTARLEVRLEGHLVQTVRLELPVLNIGRLPDNALPLPHPMVSRHHAEIRLEGGRVMLTDLGSGNGTLVQGAPLLANQPRELSGSEAILIGPFLLTYVPAATAPVAQGAGEPELPLPIVAEATPPGAATVRSTPEPDVRVSLPAPLPGGPRSAYLDDLPVIYQTNEFLGRFLLLFEAIWEPLEQRQDNIHMYFDPRTCPPAFLPWLAGWLDVDDQAQLPESRLRRLLAEAMDLYRWRGTRYGLTRVLELCTGLSVAITEDADVPFQFRVKLRLPDDGSVGRAMIEHLLQMHKPAHAGYVLDLEP